jgi:hypothetical protein
MVYRAIDATSGALVVDGHLAYPQGFPQLNAGYPPQG